MFAMSAPARHAIATPSPVAISGIGRVEINLAATAGRQDQPIGADRFHCAGGFIEHINAEAVILGREAELRRGDQIDRHVIFEKLNVRRFREPRGAASFRFRGRSHPARGECVAWNVRLPGRDRARDDRRRSRSSKCMPSSINSRIRSGPSLRSSRPRPRSHRPAPASSVSRTCSSNESSPLVTHAMPPCAQAVFESAPWRFVMIATRPCFAALKAKVSPAMPLPMTTKSNSFIRAECCRSDGCCRKKPRPREGSAARLSGVVAGRPRPRFRRNRFGRGTPT